ncbi:MAG: hypothetical protein JNM18_20915 [Planctomycetaceae bacterium]|nr:hypothetical protein [Planctomycetaceae bacterium]
MTNELGGPLKFESLVTKGELKKIDNIGSTFNRLRRTTKVSKSPKFFRKASADMLNSEPRFASLTGLFLGHAPEGVADKHYVRPPQELMNHAITWLGLRLGIDPNDGV